ncbi:MAG TPA: AbrB/MazE/SpoVT family DNA-binding domain-containing protein [Candidatus Sulfotelmatobacter sp.]|jgi:bifunctional DNA-binding transcriptional regulator/antitoxin component of YhaV-PrlF toxin-antitoxin module|nr:AbrB/MazE/SpoVT family DNA-binding domain-containing protein [Candidatus Sulfotelmatobacter sp.]
MSREYARLRERNQVTLPASVVEQMGLNLGDIVEFSTNGKGGVQLHPAKIVKVGSAEARQEESAAKQDIQEGRYTLIRSVGDFRKHVEKLRKGEAPSVAEPEAEHLTESQRHDVETVVEAMLMKLLSRLGETPRSSSKRHEKRATQRRQV